MRETMKATVGGLLHDIGKVVQRAGNSTGTHSDIGAEYLKKTGLDDPDILDCVRYHHARQLSAAPEVSDYAYITHMADNIAAGTDRRDAPEESSESGGDARKPLQSVFNLLNGKSAPHYYRPATLDGRDGVNYPQADAPRFDACFYGGITDRLTDVLKNFELSPAYVSSLLELAEAALSFVPSATGKKEVADVSLYDHMKLTAAVAGCICEYLRAEGETDCRRVLFEQGEQFYDTEFAILYSADISGIQNFIYTIHSTHALKTLRARSFYLELFMENLIDQLLDGIGFTRANLLYSGGGHFYMLLPNTPNVKTKLSEVMAGTNAWLLETFRAGLYVADGYCACSARSLRNDPEGSYGELFQTVSRMISDKKLHRYSARDIARLNNRRAEGRECRVCKAVGDHRGDECALCAALVALSGRILKRYGDDEEDVFFAVTRAGGGRSVPVSDTLYVSAVKKEDLINRPEDGGAVVRCYGKNVYYAGKSLSTKLWVGDYSREKELSEYAKQAGGIDRIGVLRMDVDNLGAAFTGGFAQYDGKYNTLSRTAAFSRHLTMFFKRTVNTLLHEKTRKVTVIYSGGDDMFLIGSWDDIIDAALDISAAFRRCTQGKLTVSAGIGLYPGKYPIHIMARETGELEDCAKGRPAKNAVVLHTPEFCFSWDELREKVIGEKLSVLDGFFSENRERGNAFLYQILAYMQGVEAEEKTGRAKISLARYAYLLAHAEPETVSDEARQKYRQFSEQMYRWITDAKERTQFKAAVCLYIYSKRGEA